MQFFLLLKFFLINLQILGVFKCYDIHTNIVIYLNFPNKKNLNYCIHVLYNIIFRFHVTMDGKFWLAAARQSFKPGCNKNFLRKIAIEKNVIIMLCEKDALFW